MAEDSSSMVQVETVGEVTIATICRTSLTDEDNLQEFGQSIQDLAAANPHSKLVLDVSELQHVTSAVLGKWIAVHRSIARAGGRMILCGAGRELNEILEATRLKSLFEITDDRAAALVAMES